MLKNMKYEKIYYSEQSVIFSLNKLNFFFKLWAEGFLDFKIILIFL